MLLARPHIAYIYVLTTRKCGYSLSHLREPPFNSSLRPFYCVQIGRVDRLASQYWKKVDKAAFVSTRPAIIIKKKKTMYTNVRSPACAQILLGSWFPWNIFFFTSIQKSKLTRRRHNERITIGLGVDQHHLNKNKMKGVLHVVNPIPFSDN